MAAKFVISHLDEQLGPFDEAELRERYIKGEFLPIDYVFDDSQQDWVLLAERFPWAAAAVEPITPPPTAVTSANKATPPQPPKSIELASPLFSLVPPALKIPSSQGPAAVDLSKSQHVQLVGGRGEIDLSQLPPGQIEVGLSPTTSNPLALENPLKIHLRAADPARVEWTAPPSQTVGHDVEIQITVRDQDGQTCGLYEQKFTVRIQAQHPQEIPVSLRQGEAVVRLQNTKTESWKLTLHAGPGHGASHLPSPEEKTIVWHPGPAVKLVLDGPQEFIAGRPLKVAVRAVDTYGNLADDYEGTIQLDVKAN